MRTLLAILVVVLAVSPLLTAAFQLPLIAQSPSRTVLHAGNFEDAPTSVGSRRQAIRSVLASALALSIVDRANAALDMDAFVNSQLESDTTNCDPKKDPKCKPQLSQDQALCQYGQRGADRAQACQRVKAAGGTLPSASPGGKSLGGAYAL